MLTAVAFRRPRSFRALKILLNLRIRRESRASRDVSRSRCRSKNEPSEYLAHLLERAVNLRRSNPGQRRDRLLDALGRDPAQTYTIVRDMDSISNQHGEQGSAV